MPDLHKAPESPLESPSPPASPDDMPPFPLISPPKQQPSLTKNMTPSSTPLGAINAARGGPRMNPDLAAQMKAFSISRSSAPIRPSPQTNNSAVPMSPAAGGMVGGIPANFLPPHLARPAPNTSNSSPAVPAPKMSMMERRGMKLPGNLPTQPQAPSNTTTQPTGGLAKRKGPKMTLSQMNADPSANGQESQKEKPQMQSKMDEYKKYLDTANGALKFENKAVIHAGGIDFANGRSFSISLDEVDTQEELGKGNYGTVWKVKHARPKVRRPGQGLAGNKPRGPTADDHSSQPAPAKDGTSGVVMAMKEIRLELDDAKFQTIIMELDILHRCISPFIVDFYGAFFQEGAVYICMEWMDGGSIEKIYGDGIPENILRKITLSTVQALKSLKEDHNIIHRDVKPTNILANTRGHVKITDFGVSGNLVASIAKTNIGCQSYMAPERIYSAGPGGGPPGAGGTYNVQSDIWSLGLTMIECALGRYPYPPETYDNIFSQLAAIVEGEPPDLPADRFSEAARDFVAGCLNKIPKLRATYPMLLQHAWLAPLLKPDVISEEDEEAAERAHAEGKGIPSPDAGSDGEFHDREVGEWVMQALQKRREGKMAKSLQPALHAVALDAVSPQESRTGVATAGA